MAEIDRMNDRAGNRLHHLCVLKRVTPCAGGSLELQLWLWHNRRTFVLRVLEIRMGDPESRFCRLGTVIPRRGIAVCAGSLRCASPTSYAR